jgi:hypothetical protein
VLRVLLGDRSVPLAPLPRVAAALRPWLERALAPEPERRFAHARAMRDEAPAALREVAA